MVSYAPAYHRAPLLARLEVIHARKKAADYRVDS